MGAGVWGMPFVWTSLVSSAGWWFKSSSSWKKRGETRQNGAFHFYHSTRWNTRQRELLLFTSWANKNIPQLMLLRLLLLVYGVLLMMSEFQVISRQCCPPNIFCKLIFRSWVSFKLKFIHGRYWKELLQTMCSQQQQKLSESTARGGHVATPINWLFLGGQMTIKSSRRRRRRSRRSVLLLSLSRV